MGLLKFTLLCIDLLAWPVIALGYPLFASIRAIESGSKSHMKKLVIYWTIFSLFSLFEFAFVRIIEWIPFWSSVRLVVVLWLVLPRFDGACHAYNGLVRPVLWGKVEAVINMLYKLREKRFSKRKTYSDAVEKYINENGPEALEKLIAMEHKSLKCIDSERDTNVIELHRNNAAMASEQLNEPDAARVRFLDGLAKQLNEPDAATRVRVYDWFSEQVQNAQSISSAPALNETDAATNSKEITLPQASAETPPFKKTHQDWTCDLCKFTATTEVILNAHLQGRKHKSNLESLKASMLNAKDTVSSPLVQQHTQSVSASWVSKETYAAAEAKDLMPPKETAENRRPVIPPLKKAQQEWTYDLCKVTTASEKKLNDHPDGSKHKSKLETLKASKHGTQDTGPSASATIKLNHGNVAEKLIKKTGSELEKLIASKMPNAEVEEMTPLEANTKNRCPETPPSKHTQQECSFGLCKSKTTSEIALNNHLQWTLESLKASMLDAKGPSPLETQQECSCGLCKITTKSEITLNDHLQGSKHKSKLESLKASMLDAKGPSPLFDGACHAYQGLVRPILLVKLQAFIERFYKLKEERLFKRETFLDVVEKYIKENGSEVLEKLIALEHESQNCINFQRDAEILEPRGQNAAATLKQLNEPKAGPRDTKMLEATEKSAATKTQRVQYSKSVSSAWVVKDTTPLEARAENRRSETPPLKQTQLEWACDICKVEAMSEIMLNDHLQGSKHMSKLESLKARMLDAKDTEPSHSDKLQKETVEVKEIIPAKETAEKRCPEIPPLKKAQQDWTCDLCKVTTTSEMDLNAHLHGIKHMFKLETLKACKLGAKDTGPSPSATSDLNHCNVAEKCVKESGSGLVTLAARKSEHEGCNSSHRDIQVVDSGKIQGSTTSQKVQGQNAQSIKAVWVPKGKDVNAEVKEMAPPEEKSAQNRCVETPPLKKAHQEPTSDLCKETAPSENLLSANLEGCKNKAKFESLKWSKITSKDTGLSPSSTCKVNHGNLVGAEHKDGEGSVIKDSEKGIYKHWCTVCDVKLMSDIDLASHLKGKRHSSNF